MKMDLKQQIEQELERLNRSLIELHQQLNQTEQIRERLRIQILHTEGAIGALGQLLQDQEHESESQKEGPQNRK